MAHSQEYEINLRLRKVLKNNSLRSVQLAGEADFPKPPIYDRIRMNRVIRELVKNLSVTPGEAADQVDKFVHDLRRKLRKGEQAFVPGIGVLTPGSDSQIIKERNAKPTASRTRRRGR